MAGLVAFALGQPLLGALALLATPIAVFGMLQLRKLKTLMQQMTHVVENAANGDLEPRLLGIHDTGEVKQLALGINHLLDLTDAFVREARASLACVRDDIFYRRILERGMLGSFKAGAATMNEAVRAMDIKFRAQIAALNRVQAIAEFSLDGKLQHANEIFLRLMGYSLDEVKGHSHSIFVDPAKRQDPAYARFWAQLDKGEFDAGVYKRTARGGREVWLQGSYNPIMGADGKPFKVILYATDITEQKLAGANFEGQLAAISKAVCVLELSLDGRVTFANDNFLDLYGYSFAEIRDKHHSLFVEPAQAQSGEYRVLWDKLNRGEYDAGQYRQVGKGGREVWLQASFNPIIDPNGHPFKIVVFGTDVTAQVQSTRMLQVAVKETQDVITAAKNNDLSLRVPLGGKSGEIVELCAGVNGLIDNMSEIVLRIIEATGSIADSSREILAGNTNLSQRTEEQASSLEETSASLEELTGTVRQNADSARQANQLAGTATNVATRGGEIVGNVVTTMEGISDSSRKIADIIGVIDEIAFQTNILALNASVEAARAGEQGKGFAVVAAEVRSLAQRSADAAREIKELIVDSVNKVDTGSRLVESAGKTMEEIVSAVQRVSHIMSEIAAATDEQRNGIEQVNIAVGQMDKITQQNAALGEEAAAAAKSMDEQTAQLADMVAKFRLEQQGASPARASTPAWGARRSA